MSGFEWKGLKDIYPIKWNGYMCFLAFVLSVCTVFMTRMQFTGGVWGGVEQNYFNPFGISAVVLFFICLPIYYIVFTLVDAVWCKCLSIIYFEEKKEYTYNVLVFWAIIIFVAWIPYYISYYPGGIYSDTFVSISYSLEGILSNRHPFFYNCLIGLAIKCGQALNKNLTWSLGLFLAAQMLFLGAEILYFLHWMLVKSIHRYIRTAIMIFFCFFTLIPFYSISIWKDTPFCMAVLLWSIFLTDFCWNILKNEYNYRTMFKFTVGVVLVAFTRNNGIYVVLFSTGVFIITTLKKSFAKKKMTYCWMVLVIIAIFFVQGPLYKLAGVKKTDTVEHFGIPLQQIGAVVAYDGNITVEQREILNRFIPHENIKEHYCPCLVDSLKWGNDMDSGYLSENTIQFLDLWANLLIQNPKIYLKAYLLATAGFWNVDVSVPDAYVQTRVFEGWEQLLVTQTDYFEEWFGFSFQHFVNPRHYISCAWFFWIFFVSMLFAMKHYGWRTSYLFSPQMGVWLTIMIATPIAGSLRYIASLLFTLPFTVIIPILLERERMC